jgi:hypothetical protein
MCRSGRDQAKPAIFGSTIKYGRKPKERKMSKFNSTHTFTAAAAIGAAAVFSMLSFGSSAEASSVFKCEGTTAKKVVSCCHEMTRNHRPFWMIKSGKNCTQITVVCHKAKASTASTAAGLPIKRCYVKLENDDNPNGGGGNPGDGSGTKRDGGRGPNTPNSSPN